MQHWGTNILKMESKTVERLLKLEAMNNFVDNEDVQTSAVDDDPDQTSQPPWKQK